MTGAPTRTRLRTLTPAAAALLLWAAWPGAGPVAAQAVTREIRESRDRLEQIRLERERLQKEMEELRTRVRDASREVANLQRQAQTSALALGELDYQTALLSANTDSINAALIRTRDRLQERSAVLHHRLRGIYKDGPLHTVRVLLGARSFGDLLNRYKYLHLVTLHDRALLRDVRRLEGELEESEAELRQSRIELEYLRDEKLAEVERLAALESRARRTLTGFRRQGEQTEGRLRTLEEDERRLTTAIAELERRRLEEERRRVVAGGAAAGEGYLTTRDLGSLSWPVEGELAYRFGPERRPNGVVLRWNGIGIRAAPGSPVRVVEEGTVVHAGPTEGYGLSVWVSHGGGYYTLYLHLRSLAVRPNQRVEAGQVVGAVGGEATPEGPHVEFQVRLPGQGGVPEAVDPLPWLRARGR